MADSIFMHETGLFRLLLSLDAAFAGCEFLQTGPFTYNKLHNSVGHSCSYFLRIILSLRSVKLPSFIMLSESFSLFVIDLRIFDFC